MRKFGFYLILVVFAFVATLFFAELAVTVYHIVRDGKYISPGERLAAEKNVYVEVARAQTPSKGCGYGDSLIVHPYLAYVQAALGPCGVGYANSKSLIGKEFPDRPRPRTGIILVTGGSVAAQFVWDNRKEESPLERILNAEFTGDRFDRFIVLNGGHGAWKQPNQYIFFGLYADILAGVITLDGVNGTRLDCLSPALRRACQQLFPSRRAPRSPCDHSSVHHGRAQAGSRPLPIRLASYPLSCFKSRLRSGRWCTHGPAALRIAQAKALNHR
jgi:hypothetical protein